MASKTRGTFEMIRGLLDSARVFYKLAKTGSVQRTVNNKLGDVATLYDFGAVGDGVHDDTAAIQAAIAAYAGGGTVRIPAGVFTTTLPLDLAEKKINLVGSGLNQSTIMATASMPYLISAREPSTTYSFNEFSLAGIKFDGNNLANITFGLEHRHFCSITDCAFFSGVQYAHVAKNSWLNNYRNCSFGASDVGVLLQGSNHRNAFYSCSWIGMSSQCLQIIDGVDGNSAIAFYNCDWEFQNGSTDVTAVYIASNATYAFNDCYIGENINGIILFMDGNGSIQVNGGILFNGVSPTGRLFRTSGAGAIHVKGAEIIGGSYSSIASLGSQFGTKFSLEDCRLGFSTLGIQTLVGEGLNRKATPNPVTTYGKGWSLNKLDGAANQSFSGTGQTVAVTSPSTSGLMILSSPLDTTKLSVGLGPSGRFSRVLITYQSNTNANLITTNTVGGAAVNNLGSIPLSSLGKSCVVMAVDITGGTILEIIFSTGTGATFTLFDVTVLDAADVTNENATMINLYKAK